MAKFTEVVCKCKMGDYTEMRKWLFAAHASGSFKQGVKRTPFEYCDTMETSAKGTEQQQATERPMMLYEELYECIA